MAGAFVGTAGTFVADGTFVTAGVFVAFVTVAFAFFTMTGMLHFFIPLTITVNFVLPAFFPVITSCFLLTLTVAIFLFAIFALIFFLPAFFTLIVVFFLTFTVTCFLLSFTLAAADALVTPVPGIGIILSTIAPANTQAAAFLPVLFFISISFHALHVFRRLRNTIMLFAYFISIHFFFTGSSASIFTLLLIHNVLFKILCLQMYKTDAKTYCMHICLTY